MPTVKAPLLIVGQGLAGSCLGWACEQAQIPFEICDRGALANASCVGAGLITPLTGQRLVPTWRIAEWLPVAIEWYRKIEEAVGVQLVTKLRIRRRYRDADERRRWTARLADPAIARWVEEHDAASLWIDGAVQVDTGALVASLRARWSRQGCWREGLVHGVEVAAMIAGGRRVIWCPGAVGAPEFEFVPWQRAKGEIIDVEVSGLEPGILLHDGNWVLPTTSGLARVGATFARDFADELPTVAARAELIAAGERLTGKEVALTAHRAAVRVTTPDRRPVLGWHPMIPNVGIFAGLGAKGALWAPALAQQGLALLREGRPVDAEVTVSRFWPSRSRRP